MVEQPNGASHEDALENFEQLVWMYFDEVLPQEELPKLEEMLRSDDRYVQVYLDCAKLHADLTSHFQPPKPIQLPGVAETPVLGSLGDGMTGFDARPPVT